MTPFERTADTVIGVAAPAIGLITSVQEQVEYGLRVFSLVIGIVVGLVSLYRLLKKSK